MADTSLRYTDVLFGFVIKELFVRLQNWRNLDTTVCLQLVVGTTLVLGSWIGYRRSVHRAQYEVKFFNLPFFRFLADQAMLILYFRIAVLTDVDPAKRPPPAALAAHTAFLLGSVFLLYLVWDILGIWMAKASTDEGVPKYSKIDSDRRPTKTRADSNVLGFVITLVSWLLFCVLACLASNGRLDAFIVLGLATALLLVYRFAKEIRTSLC